MSDRSDTRELLLALDGYHRLEPASQKTMVIGAALEVIKHSNNVSDIKLALSRTVEAIEEELNKVN